jgi:hypothetical protein
LIVRGPVAPTAAGFLIGADLEAVSICLFGKMKKLSPMVEESFERTG